MAGDWETVILGKYASKIGSGATPRGGAESYLDAGPYALIRSQNVLDFQFKHFGLAFIDEEQARTLDGVSVQVNDILLNITGDSVARVCMIDTRVLPARVNQHVAIIRADPDHFEQRYLFYVLAEPSTKQRLLAIASSGGTRNALTKGDLERLVVPKPPIREQRLIANLLGSIDDKIELNRRIASTLEGIGRALFNSWFVDFDPVRDRVEGRMPGLNANVARLFPDSLGEDGFPSGWASTANDIGCSIREQVQPNQVDPTTSYVGLEHIERRSLALNVTGRAREVESQKSVFRRGDLLFGKLRPYFHKVSIAPMDGICSTDIFVFRPKDGIPPSYLYFAFSTESFVAKASGAQEGTRMPRADWGFMQKLPMPKPCPEILTAFDAAVSPLVEKILATVEQSRSLMALRDILLPKLVSGEVRIKAAGNDVEAA